MTTDDTPRDPLAALLADLFPESERARWPFTVEMAAARLRNAGVEMGLDVERLAQAVQDVDFASDLPASGQRTVSHHVRRKAVQYARQYAATPEAPHKHDWVDARNTVVASGEVCLVCGAVRATPELKHDD